MSSDGLRGFVGFPDVHLSATRSVFTQSRVLVGGFPAIRITFTVDELDVMRALSITIANTVVSSSLVAVFAHTTISIHLREVKGTVKSTREGADINIEGKLSVLKVELHVVVILVQQESSRSNIFSVGVLGHEAKLEGVSLNLNSISRFPFIFGDSVKSTVLCASFIIRTELWVPGVSLVAVLIAANSVNPSPISIDGDSTSLFGATSSLGTGLVSHSKVFVSRLMTNLLSNGSSHKESGCESFEHIFVVLNNNI
jgi:hypothetical protein